MLNFCLFIFISAGSITLQLYLMLLFWPKENGNESHKWWSQTPYLYHHHLLSLHVSKNKFFFICVLYRSNPDSIKSLLSKRSDFWSWPSLSWLVVTSSINKLHLGPKNYELKYEWMKYFNHLYTGYLLKFSIDDKVLLLT